MVEQIEVTKLGPTNMGVEINELPGGISTEVLVSYSAHWIIPHRGMRVGAMEQLRDRLAGVRLDLEEAMSLWIKEVS